MLDLPARKSFSVEKPWLQHAWDSTSLGVFLRCPRRYFYEIVCGYRTRAESVHLTFGTLIHSAMEEYHLERQTSGHTEAQIKGLVALLRAAWEGEKYWQSEDRNKNFWNALRAFIWYTETFAFEPDFNTASIGRKISAIELPFQFSLGDFTSSGEEIVYCGHLDRVVDTASGRWVIDYKTTKKTLGADYFDTYQPSTQLPGYAVAAKIVFHEPVQGVIVDAFQVGVDFTRNARGHILLGAERADEWLDNASSWIAKAVEIAEGAASPEERHWKMNTESCFICPFKEVCRSTPSVRPDVLKLDFKQRFWDPLDRGQEKAA